MSVASTSFTADFLCLTSHAPMRWQSRLFEQFLARKFPAAVDLPTGFGKTSVMAIWLLARAHAAKDILAAIPRRLIYVVDRRVVVDQATAEAQKLRAALAGEANRLGDKLGLNGRRLPLSTLRGSFVDNREWLEDPSLPAIIVATVDMIGSRLLFEGYGISRRMRPYHAGLLGADVLFVLDEAHLVPPFANLLRTIECDALLQPSVASCVPRFAVLPLSATQRARPAEAEGANLFGLEEEDREDEVAAQRLNARKELRVEPLAGKDHDKELAAAALELATRNGPARVVVFCDRREKKDEGGGPSAQGVAEAIVTLAKGDKKAAREKIEIDSPGLLVGACRVHEREKVARRLRELGFINPTRLPDKPAFLVATSAGEVGVDLDADHMVCDLVPWERMVQRLGRVNRRGDQGREACVVVFDTSVIVKDEGHRNRLTATLDLLTRTKEEFGGNVCPAALLELRGRVGFQEIEKASTPEPFHPALTRPLADAWSMTSLERHTGRPEIAPWLRGWVEEKPQTSVVWREHLPLRLGAAGQAIFSSEDEINEFLDAAPPQESEKLETETYRVADWLHSRAIALLQRRPQERVAAADGSDDLATEDETGATGPDQRELGRDDVVLLVLSPSAEYERHLTLDELAQEFKGRAKDDFQLRLVGRMLIVDARFGGLEAGLLQEWANSGRLETADATDKWSRRAGFRVRRSAPAERGRQDEGWGIEDEFVLCTDDDGEPLELLIVEHFEDAAQSEEGRSISNPQELVEHHNWAEEKARGIASRVGLIGVGADALALAARVHDEGKRAERWQRAFRADRDARRYGLSRPLAKTRGPIDHAILDGYRHELGSLPYAEARTEIQALPEEWRDLILHLIAAHHGQARPVIATRGGDEPPSVLANRARNVALRFARLQRRWGPWGLAWWEALLRAADQQASRANDRRAASSSARREQ
jgi:CRISPR-associated endonuclease/helicase Cas3